MSNYALSALRALQDGKPRRAYDLLRVAARLPKSIPRANTGRRRSGDEGSRHVAKYPHMV